MRWTDAYQSSVASAAGAPRARRTRRGVIAVEAAIVMPTMLILMLGLWEVGRLVDVSMTLNAAAREGARMAAGGTNNGTSTTVAMVQQAVKDYLSSAGFPTAAVNGAQVSVVNLSPHSWSEPYQALPLDPFKVVVNIPAGAPFNSLRWVFSSLTGVNQLSAQAEWFSANDAEVVISAQLPY